MTNLDGETVTRTEEYTVGWVCALPLEMAAAKGMLDHPHPNLLKQDEDDHNSYILGDVQGHNVVIACLPAGFYGLAPAATVAKDLLRTFKSIRFGLMVGIGGGIPSPTHDIRLGDIVVSQPIGATGGVIQYDRGKAVQDGKFQRTGSLNTPPQVLLSALSRLQADHLTEESKIPQFLSKIVAKVPKKMKNKFSYQGANNDCLFQADYDHISASPSCDYCDHTKSVQRDDRDDSDPVIHYGTIASGNQVIKHGQTRDRLGKELGALCFEMEAAGLQDFPCLVIRGICDYSDSHKNKRWQEYAAAVAAAFAKELLSVIPPTRVIQDKPIPQLVSDPQLHALVVDVNATISKQTYKEDVRYETQQHIKCHQAFKTSTYEAFKNINPDRVAGTCKWVLEHPRYIEWHQSSSNGLLWISADPGCGKSVLAKALIDEEFKQTKEHVVCYFFFKDNENQNSLVTALCALLHQLFSYQPSLLRHAIAPFVKDGDKLKNEVDELWRIFSAAANDDQAPSITCVLDALDECCINDRQKLIQLLIAFHNHNTTSKRRYELKFLVTSRPYQDIETEFTNMREPNSIRLAGEDANAGITKEINLVIVDKVTTISRNLQLSQEVKCALQERLLSVTSRTYLWLHLVIDEISHSSKRTEKGFLKMINSLPTTVEDAYEKILRRLNHDQEQEARTVLHIVVSARRPLTLSEMDIAFQLATDSSEAQLQEDIDFDLDHLKSRIRILCGLFVFVNDNRIYLIHQTAKEFLVAKNGLSNPANGHWKYSLNSQCSNTIMTRVCVLYLSLKDVKDFHPNEVELKQLDSSKFPFLEYAAVHWPEHSRNASLTDQDLVDGMFGLYKTYHHTYQTWVQIFGRETHYGHLWTTHKVHLAALNGHGSVLATLLASNPGIIDLKDDYNDTPLIWGCRGGHIRIVQLLLDKGANVNAKGAKRGEYGNALQAASATGHDKIVQLLLDRGANVNAKGGNYGSALQAASAKGYDKIVQLLLERGANVNTKGGEYGNALLAASSEGYAKIVQLLLDGGADVDDHGWYWDSALQTASSRGYDKIFQLLLDSGANVHDQGQYFGSALHAASEGGHAAIVQLLLDRGAYVDAQRGEWGTALRAASTSGDISTVKILVNNGANVNTLGHICGSALRVASERGHDDIVQFLLDNGADANDIWLGMRQ